jgi:hypothetical protein
MKFCKLSSPSPSFLCNATTYAAGPGPTLSECDVTWMVIGMGGYKVSTFNRSYKYFFCTMLNIPENIMESLEILQNLQDFGVSLNIFKISQN